MGSSGHGVRQDDLVSEVIDSLKEQPAPARPQEPLHRPWIWAVYLLLFGIAIPWYLPRDGSLRIWLGLPHWVVISLAATLGIALFTVFVIRRFWIEEEDESNEGE